MEVRLRPGGRAWLLDVSSAGAAVAMPTRLRVGALLTVELALAPEVPGTPDVPGPTVRARVLRCAVRALEPSGVSYRSSLQFETTSPLAGELATRAGYSVPGKYFNPAAATGTHYPHQSAGRARRDEGDSESGDS